MLLLLPAHAYCLPDDYLHHGQDLEHAVDMLFNSRFFDEHTDRMINLMMDLMETVCASLSRSPPPLNITALLQRQSQDPVDSVTKLHILLHTLMQYGLRRPHIFKLLREPRMSAFRHQSKPFIHLLIEILNRTEEEAHATGKDSSVEGMIGHEAAELLYEVLRVKRLSREELRESSLLPRRDLTPPTSLTTSFSCIQHQLHHTPV